MSKYRFSIDAGIFTGARYIEPEFPTADGKGKVKIPGIFIPTGINGIDIKADTRDEGKRNASGFRAFLTFVHRGLSGKYIQTIRDRLTREGEQITAYNVPAYSVCYTLPEDKRAKIRAVLAKRVIAEHPELANQTDTQGTDLAKAISTLMPFQMGDSYLIEEQNTPQQPRNSSAPVAQGVTGYSTQAPTDYADPFGGEEAPDDLPF